MRETRPGDPTWADVTPKADFLNRHQIIAGASARATGAIDRTDLGSYNAAPPGTSTEARDK